MSPDGNQEDQMAQAIKKRGWRKPVEPVKRGPGRPPKHGEAMEGWERQSIYAKARARDMAEVAYALQQALQAKETRTSFVASYKGTPSGERLRRGLARILNAKATDDPAKQDEMQATLAFFDDLIDVS
jgi:hypothetical protein